MKKIITTLLFVCVFSLSIFADGVIECPDKTGPPPPPSAPTAAPAEINVKTINTFVFWLYLSRIAGL